MRTCTVCLKIKPNNEYFYRDKRAEKLHSQCKSCYIEKRRKTWKQYYHKHGSKYRQNAVERNRRIKDLLRQQMMNYLSDKSCVQCGVNDIRVLDFDHIDPSKKSFSISQAITNTRSWDVILKEIKKCQILCSNCHKIKTATEQSWYRSTPDQLDI